MTKDEEVLNAALVKVQEEYDACFSRAGYLNSLKEELEELRNHIYADECLYWSDCHYYRPEDYGYKCIKEVPGDIDDPGFKLYVYELV